MAEKDNTFQNTVEALFRGMDSFITTKTVVGEAIHIEDTILLPLVDVSFGVGAGAFAENAKNNAGGGMGGKISPSAVLVISKNGTRLVNIKNQDAVTKIIDMAPDLISRFTGKKELDEKEIGYSGPYCALRMMDVGAALVSAAKTASLLNLDNRIQQRVGAAAKHLGLIDAEVVMGIPVGFYGKSIFFDRSAPKH